MSVVFYTRRGCHLCDEAEVLLRNAGVRWEEVDVDDDRVLQLRYGERVPVIEVDGTVVAEGNLAGLPLRELLGKVR